MLTAEYLRSIVSYDPNTGDFTWIVDTGKKRMIGKPAGYTDATGRKHIRIARRLYRAARLAWLHVHGSWPADQVDHVNGDPSDDRMCNLREATRSQNMANKKRAKHNSSGVKGVHFHPQSGKWRAVVRIDGRNRHIGLFSDKHEAGRAYFSAAQNLFGDFATMRG